MRRLRPRLPVLAGIAVLVALLARLGAGAFVDGIRAVDAPSVLAALTIGLLTTVLSAGRWWLVARALGVALPPARAVADTYRAQFVNSVLPAGVLGDVHRAVSHGLSDGGRGARAVVLERVAGQAVVVTAGVGVLLAMPTVSETRSPREAVAAVTFGAAGYGAAQGVTVAVVFGVLGLVACLPGAALLLVRRTRTVEPVGRDGLRGAGRPAADKRWGRPPGRRGATTRTSCRPAGSPSPRSAAGSGRPAWRGGVADVPG